jgi:hypothetical protein
LRTPKLAGWDMNRTEAVGFNSTGSHDASLLDIDSAQDMIFQGGIGVAGGSLPVSALNRSA